MVTATRFQIDPCPLAESERLQEALGLARVTADTLVRRGLGDPAAARRFLDLHGPQHDPLLLGDAEEACTRIGAAIDAGRPIVVHGDYDADGVCATAVLVAVLRDLGAEVRAFLPSRFDEGYGLAVETVERLHAEGCGLLVTVDCGITAVEAAERAAQLGLELVITDHHRTGARLPQCPLVVPRGHGAYPFPDLCGSGVAYKLGQALVASRGADPRTLEAQLDLVALASVADLVPLVDENRGLVRAGLERLRSGVRPGLAALMRVAKVDRARAGSTEIGFRLAPRINAAGRMGHPDVALELLTTEDQERARVLADRLDALNRERQAVEAEILREALAQVEALDDERRAARGLVLASTDWHPGVIGIVAARLVERLARPVVLVALEGEEGRGSGRSIPSFDLHAALGACGEHLVAFGGHRAAAGVTVRADRVEDFARAFAGHADAVVADDDLVPMERIDAVASIADVSLELADELRMLEPFGLGNPAVSVLVPAVELGGLTTLGAEGRHLRFAVRSAAGSCRTVHWGAGEQLARLSAGGRFDVACRIERNDWNGSSTVQLTARAVSPVPSAAAPAPGVCSTACDATCPDLARPGERHLSLVADPPAEPTRVGPRVVDRSGGSAVAELTRLAAAGEGLLVLCGDVARRRVLLRSVLHPSRFGLDGAVLVSRACRPAAARARLQAVAGRRVLALADLESLAALPDLAEAFAHVALLDPPTGDAQRRLLERLPAHVSLHLVAGAAERAAAERRVVSLGPRELCAGVWRLLGSAPLSGVDLGRVLAASPTAPPPEDVDWALEVLVDAGAVRRDGDRFVRVESTGPVRLDAVPAYAARLAQHAPGVDGLVAAPA